jgi:hypothetical protein
VIVRLLRWILFGLAWLAGALAILWAAGALGFDLPAPPLARKSAAVVWLLGALGLWTFGRRRGRLTVAVGFAVLLAWWLSIAPRHDRDWKPEVATLAYAEFAGERVTIHNVRNFDYRTENDFTPRYDTRTYDLAKLRTFDMFLNYWGSPLIAHPIISFDFGDQGRLCFSIETRPEKGESYSALGGFYRQYELIYIPADERDVIGVRTNHRTGEDVYLYKLDVGPEVARQRFREYTTTLNQLHARPRWYNALTANCTTSIRAQHDAAQRAPLDWRLIANGKMDEMLYEQGMIPHTLPFAALKPAAHINERARAAGLTPDFSTRIRTGTPGFE